MPVFNYYPNELRDIICSCPFAEVAASRAASNAVTTFPSIRYNPDYAMEVARITQNVTFVTQDRRFRHIMSRAANYRESLFCKMQEDRRSAELGYTGILLSSKATIRYRIEVK